MAKQPKLNSLDLAINSRLALFNSIDDYKNTLIDEDFKKAHIFIATKIEGLNMSRLLLINSYVPAVNKTIFETKKQIDTSIYKIHIKSLLEDNLNVLKDDTIRLGYVMFFHKYENFIKDYMAYLNQRYMSHLPNAQESFSKFCVNKFQFSPTQWHKYPIVHQVNFISNCTKHQDGKCKLDDPKHKKATRYINVPDTESVKPTVEQFKEDTICLLNSIADMLIPILENALLYCIYQDLLSSHRDLIISTEDAIKSNLSAQKETFLEEGIENPVLDGQNLQEYIDRIAKYRESVNEISSDIEEIKRKITSCEDKIMTCISQYESELTV